MPRPARAPGRRRSPICCRWPWRGTAMRRPSATRSATSGSTSPTRSSARSSRRSRSGWWTSAIEPGDKISILAHTRPEWTHACFGILTAGATLVTIYQTNSPEEVPVRPPPLGLARDLRRGRRAAREGARDRGPVPRARARDRDGLRRRRPGRRASRSMRCASAAAAATRRSTRRATALSRPDDMCLYIYTSGTTGPPKGCLLSHGNYRAITDSVVAGSVLEGGDCAYLFLPLAHAFAVLIQFASFELGVAIAYWSRDPKMIIADIAQVSPIVLPVGAAHVREDLHARHREHRGQGAAPAGGAAGREGAHDARGGRAGAGRARGRLRRRPRRSSSRTCADCSARTSASA